ncbi:16S rRNA (cytosine(1402)-N(4))-methyltransferase RsmH [Propylenella binzhouense]|uniref:Ribosomal RNA small subunit methyltransferase H n=1 Tax=Propylenella binzhouense TaxID=2555902 RepID=A0A964T3U0_9HYPH|nr:16S rRNA (cytosine(1402)-N(4))-methyltransferase RsmH [Propylenella binzhouense]MYZ47799.1 16S rRNA (cytosine(1402)-N(4))-methyltransferase RsmH [Propylenella binzhouense]
MAGRPSDEGAGGPARHLPVLLAEVLAALAVVPGGRYVDGTFGAGGYSRAILEAGGTVLAIDRDPKAVADGQAIVEKFRNRLILVEGRFSDLEAHVAAQDFAPVDGVVLDIGVSSMQLDEAERGFSFRKDGPLDMRMGAEGPDAAAIVNRAAVRDLAVIFGALGEERHAGRVARAVEAARSERPIETTRQLAEIVERAVGRPGPQRIHPATRTFQGLRIFVNRELEELAEGLGAAESVLKPGGRLAVVTFHSLEDRIVKRFLQSRSRSGQGSRHAPIAAGPEPSFELLNRKPVEPSAEETERNPRARSARLRAAIRTGAPAHALDMAAIGVPLLTIPGPEAYR